MFNKPKEIRTTIINWIRTYFHSAHEPKYAVLGISGGKDSSIAAALCKEALGKDRVAGIMMPDGEQSDINDSIELIESLGISDITVNIGEITDAFYKCVGEGLAQWGLEVSEDAKINTPPRIRMAVLYAIAASLDGKGLVINTCNASEDFVGYSTKFGDSAGDLSPLGGSLVEEVLQLGDTYEEIPEHLVHKTPSDGLCGQTDEDKLGFTYAQLDSYLNWLKDTSTECPVDDDTRNRIEKLHKANIHKLIPMPTFRA